MNRKLDNLKFDVEIDTVDLKRKEFMNKIANNPKLLENFSTDRLVKILQYCIKENEKKRKRSN